MRTQVSKTSAAIKKILANTVGRDWRGWAVYVEEVDPAWTLQLPANAREPLAYRATADGKSPRQIARSSVGAIVDSPSFGEVLVVKQTGSGPRWHTGPVTIYIPRLDEVQMDVALDAQLSLGRSDPRRRALLAPFGPYAEIAQAVLEAQQKTLAKAQRGKSSRQLDREIAEFLSARAPKAIA